MEIFAQTIISQYANAPTLTQLVANMNDYLDPGANFDAFFNLIWDVDTAVGYGLDVWGRIVVVSRVLNVSVGSWFGFAEATDANGFNQQSFYAGAGATSNYALADDAYRTLILAKALANICDGSIPATNQIMLNLFPGRGDCYVVDNLDMTMSYKFNFALSPVELAIVSQSGVLPRGAGVLANVIHL